MTTEESGWRKHDGKRKVPKPKHETHKHRDPKKEKVTLLSTHLSKVLIKGEKRHLILAHGLSANIGT